MKLNDKGLEVRRLQLELIDMGYALPRFGPDGHLGHETMNALRDFAEDHNIRWFGDGVPRAAIAILVRPNPAVKVAAVPEKRHGDVTVYDLRDAEWSGRPKRKFRLDNGRPLEREPEMVTGITIHQTAVKYGVVESQIKAAGGHKDAALARRSLQVACHVMAFHDGFIAWPCPLPWYVYHGNGFNSYELGIEIDGNYPGLADGKTWNGKKATVVTEPLIRAARAGVELLVREGRKLGMPVEYIHAHRQSSKRRRGDPGEELWRRVVTEYAVPELGLKTRPREFIGTGRPIPVDWDDEGTGLY